MQEYVEMFQKYSAKEMKDNSNENAMNRVNGEFKVLLEEIKNASNDGKFSMSYNKYLSVFEKELLRALGYDVLDNTSIANGMLPNRVQYSHKISWENADK